MEKEGRRMKGERRGKGDLGKESETMALERERLSLGSE